ncbi:hypothetical protein CLV42_1431, partial [Chitinophaga ginsengisoli]
RNRRQRNRMREIRSYGSVGERGGNDPLYPEPTNFDYKQLEDYMEFEQH